MNAATQPKISIITVVYNDVSHIVATMDSVLCQDYPYIEYILVDGYSSDGTTQRIESTITSLATITHREVKADSLYLEAQLDSNPNVSFKFLSERDSGIYDAMNKGIDLATGEWCNFMNCGDMFFSKESVSKFFAAYQEYLANGGKKAAVIYGDTQIIYDAEHTKIIHAAPNERKNAHKYHHHFIHQSAFIDSATMKYYKYNTYFKIAGDTDFFTKVYNAGLPFWYSEVVVSAFNVEGVSGLLSWRMFWEDLQIGTRYHKFFPIYHTLRYVFWIIPRVVVRNAIPRRFRNQARVLLGKRKQ